MGIEGFMMDNFGEKVSFIWSVADLLRDSFRRGKYPDVILPLTVLRRLDCVLEPTKEKASSEESVGEILQRTKERVFRPCF